MTPPSLRAILVLLLVLGSISVLICETEPVTPVTYNVSSNMNGTLNLKFENNKTVILPDLEMKLVYTGKGRPEPYKVFKNKTHYVIFGAYPTRKGLSYKRYDSVILNYCPHCKKYGVLKFEIQSQVNWYTSPEGLLYCEKTDMDFSLTSFTSHDGRGFRLKGVLL